MLIIKLMQFLWQCRGGKKMGLNDVVKSRQRQLGRVAGLQAVSCTGLKEPHFRLSYTGFLCVPAVSSCWLILPPTLPPPPPSPSLPTLQIYLRIVDSKEHLWLYSVNKAVEGQCHKIYIGVRYGRPQTNFLWGNSWLKLDKTRSCRHFSLIFHKL